MKIIAERRSIKKSTMIDIVDFEKKIAAISETTIKPQIEFASKSSDIELTQIQKAYSNCNIHI